MSIDDLDHESAGLAAQIVRLHEQNTARRACWSKEASDDRPHPQTFKAAIEALEKAYGRLDVVEETINQVVWALDMLPAAGNGPSDRVVKLCTSYKAAQQVLDGADIGSGFLKDRVAMLCKQWKLTCGTLNDALGEIDIANTEISKLLDEQRGVPAATARLNQDTVDAVISALGWSPERGGESLPQCVRRLVDERRSLDIGSQQAFQVARVLMDHGVKVDRNNPNLALHVQNAFDARAGAVATYDRVSKILGREPHQPLHAACEDIVSAIDLAGPAEGRGLGLRIRDLVRELEAAHEHAGPAGHSVQGPAFERGMFGDASSPRAATLAAIDEELAEVERDPAPLYDGVFAGGYVSPEVVTEATEEALAVALEAADNAGELGDDGLLPPLRWDGDARNFADHYAGPRPSYNHTRGDSPLTPCSKCAAASPPMHITNATVGHLVEFRLSPDPASSWRTATVAEVYPGNDCRVALRPDGHAWQYAEHTWSWSQKDIDDGLLRWRRETEAAAPAALRAHVHVVQPAVFPMSPGVATARIEDLDERHTSLDRGLSRLLERQRALEDSVAAHIASMASRVSAVENTVREYGGELARAIKRVTDLEKIAMMAAEGHRELSRITSWAHNETMLHVNAIEAVLLEVPMPGARIMTDGKGHLKMEPARRPVTLVPDTTKVPAGIGVLLVEEATAPVDVAAPVSWLDASRPEVTRTVPASMLAPDNTIELPAFVRDELKVQPGRYLYFVRADKGFRLMTEDAMDAALNSDPGPAKIPDLSELPCRACGIHHRLNEFAVGDEVIITKEPDGTTTFRDGHDAGKRVHCKWAHDRARVVRVNEHPLAYDVEKSIEHGIATCVITATFDPCMLRALAGGGQ